MEEEEEQEGEGKGCWRIRRRDQGRQATRWWSLVTGGWPARGEVPVSEPQVPGRVSWMTVSSHPPPPSTNHPLRIWMLCLADSAKRTAARRGRRPRTHAEQVLCLARPHHPLTLGIPARACTACGGDIGFCADESVGRRVGAAQATMGFHGGVASIFHCSTAASPWN